MIIDTHAHLSNNEYNDLEAVINKMKDNIIIISGCDNKSNHEVIDLCDRYSNIYGTLGIHPEEVGNATEDDLEFIEKNIENPKIVAVGEIGLDYYWNKDNKELQREWFEKQIELAKKYQKGVVVHARDSIQDVYDLLKKSELKKIDIHCYSSSLEMAHEFIKLGARLGIGGVLTFKNSEKLKEVVKNIDLKHLLLETDSPYLSPEPLRGKQNEPYNVKYVAMKIAELKGISLEEVLKATTSNAVDQFDLNLNI